MAYGIREEILNLKEYKAGKPIDEVKREYGLNTVIKLASNENPLGFSPKVKEVLSNLVDNANMYPDASNYELKYKISQKRNVHFDQVFCSTGSDSLIKVICNTFLNTGDESIMGEVTFSRYGDCVKLMGGKVVEIPMKNHGLDLEAMVNAINDKTKIIWLCNPNNPTGTIFTMEELENILDRIPKHVVVVMDEAYIEYVSDKNFPDSLKLLPKYNNMIILRTFSKAYGLAGLRCGYGIASKELGGYFNRVIGPFDVNLFAQGAAVAALDDDEFIKRAHDTNEEWRNYLYSEFEKLGLEYIKSNTNFIMFNCKTDDVRVFNDLLKKGIIVKAGTHLGMPGWVRVSIGTKEQDAKFIEVLKDVLNK